MLCIQGRAAKKQKSLQYEIASHGRMRNILLSLSLSLSLSLLPICIKEAILLRVCMRTLHDVYNTNLFKLKWKKEGKKKEYFVLDIVWNQFQLLFFLIHKRCSLGHVYKIEIILTLLWPELCHHTYQISFSYNSGTIINVRGI